MTSTTWVTPFYSRIRRPSGFRARLIIPCRLGELGDKALGQCATFAGLHLESQVTAQERTAQAFRDGDAEDLAPGGNQRRPVHGFDLSY